MSRLSWRDYFLDLAECISQRATCPRAQVGVVIVRDNRVLTTGYNGSLSGQKHCTDTGCDIKVTDGVEHCNRAVHAEVNAVAQAARFGVSIEGATMYVWDSLAREANCDDCRKVSLSAGVSAMVFNRE